MDKSCLHSAFILDVYKRQEQMSQALDSPLTGEEQGELEAHLACCPACRADWAALRELHQAMGELEETPVPEGFADRVMAVSYTHLGPVRGPPGLCDGDRKDRGHR